jgi:hypothetical protein
MRALVFLLAGACASAPPPAPSEAFAARVASVSPPGRDRPFVAVVIQFTNATERPITVRGYRLEWAGGSQDAVPETMVVPPGGALSRRLETRSYDAAAVGAGRVLVDTPAATRASVLY